MCCDDDFVCLSISWKVYLHVLPCATFLNTLRPRLNGHLFADDIFKCIFFIENVWISIKISLKFVPKGPINNIPALVQIMAWRRPGDKTLSEPMMVSLRTYICVTRPQWVKFRIIILSVQSCLIQLWLDWWRVSEVIDQYNHIYICYYLDQYNLVLITSLHRLNKILTSWYFVVAAADCSSVTTVSSSEHCDACDGVWELGSCEGKEFNCDVIMTTMSSQITSLTINSSIVYSGAYQRKYQSSASLAFVRGIHRDRWIPRTKVQWRGKYFHLMTSSCDDCHEMVILDIPWLKTRLCINLVYVGR